MKSLRSRLLRSLVLAWFGLFVGAAAGASIANPSTLASICTAAHGGKLMLMDAEGEVAEVIGDLHCPLCSVIEHPIASHSVSFEAPSSLAHALMPKRAAHLASATAPPLPSRGPPSLAR